MPGLPTGVASPALRSRSVALAVSIQPGATGADAVDAQLHEERVDPATRERRLHEARLGGLPDGVFVLHRGSPHLVLGDRLLRWTPAGYTDPVPRGAALITVITPPSLVALLRRGWASSLPLVHPSGARG